MFPYKYFYTLIFELEGFIALKKFNRSVTAQN